MSLDTKYRPRGFDDVLGQESIITILRKYISTGRSLHQSYLFAGPFGSGKTTLGRIMARALMCQSPKASGDPCDVCESCLSVLGNGNSMDFVEVDAATNSGKADVQKITEEIQYSSFSGRRRIYLFDEAHQLSRDALDALLKPLEENVPGSQEKRLVCIFCTTEPEKMRSTIFSRCAPTFVIQPVDPSIIATRLAHICDKEGFEYDLDMLRVVSELTECHIRDAIKAVEGISMVGRIDRDNTSKYLHLDVNLLVLDTILNIGSDLSKAMGCIKTAMTTSSPAMCYEKLSQMSMLAYQVGIGALKSPLYIDSDKLLLVYNTHKHQLIGFASKFAIRPGRPTESMLLCDVGVLHYGDAVLHDRPVVQPTKPPVGLVVTSPQPVQSKVANQPVGRADVRVNPKAVNGYSVPTGGVEQPTNQTFAEIDANTFGYLLAMQLSQYEGSPSGPTGLSNMGRT